MEAGLPATTTAPISGMQLVLRVQKRGWSKPKYKAWIGRECQSQTGVLDAHWLRPKVRNLRDGRRVIELPLIDLMRDTSDHKQSGHMAALMESDQGLMRIVNSERNYAIANL